MSVYKSKKQEEKINKSIGSSKFSKIDNILSFLVKK